MRKLFVMCVLLLGCAGMAPESRAQFCPGVSPWVFDDVLASDQYCGFITKIANQGVTLGCQIIDANHRLYCPTTAVPRNQMAAFLARLGNRYFEDGGSAFGATGILGITDNNALDIIVNNSRVMRYEPNAISPNVIGGSPANYVTAGVRGATIGGGGVPLGDTDPDFINEAPNRVTDLYGTVGGGYGNVAGDDVGATVDRPFATVGGGYINIASGYASTVGGGYINTASGFISTVGGGYANIASGYASTVGGGYGNIANGVTSTVGGGNFNTASGNYSFSAGYQAVANGSGSFTWSDSSNNAVFGPSAPGGWSNPNYTFNVRSTGGVWFVTGLDGSGNPLIGVEVLPGSGSWSTYSDRNAKANLSDIDPRGVLDRLARLPIGTWNYTTQDPAIRHIGPMAQDFAATFGFGENDTTISTVDAQGVALAAIQGLNQKLEERDAALTQLVQDNESFRVEMAALRSALAELRKDRSSVAAATK